MKLTGTNRSIGLIFQYPSGLPDESTRSGDIVTAFIDLQQHEFRLVTK
jgi:hypothetical protein